METKIILTIGYGILGLVNVYCFLFQRTTRKIRNFAVGTMDIKLQDKFLPNWYFWLYFGSFLRFVPLVWLAIIDWKYAVISFVVIAILKNTLPVNDYSNIQKIKKHFEKLIANSTASAEDIQLYEIVLEAEKKTI